MNTLQMLLTLAAALILTGMAVWWINERED